MSGTIATKHELEDLQSAISSVAEDTVTNLNELRRAINAHAETLNLHRYLLDKFIPQGLLEQACNDYVKIRQQQIEEERMKAHAPAEA